jgi:hypothetical protein
MVHETSDIQPVQLSLETLTGGVIGRKEHDQHPLQRRYPRVWQHIQALRMAVNGMDHAFVIVKLGMVTQVSPRDLMSNVSLWD